MSGDDGQEWDVKSGVGRRRRFATPGQGNMVGTEPPPFFDEDGKLQEDNVVHFARRLWPLRNLADELLNLMDRVEKMELDPARFDREIQRLKDRSIVLFGINGNDGKIAQLEGKLAGYEKAQLELATSINRKFWGAIGTLFMAVITLVVTKYA